MGKQGFYYEIGGDIDLEGFLAELFWNDENWGEISCEGGELLLTIYPRDDGEPWRFDPIAAERLMNRARRDLVEGRPPEDEEAKTGVAAPS